MNGAKIPASRLCCDPAAAASGDWKFHALSAAVAEAVVTLDRRGRILSWNRAAESLFGHSADEALGRDLFPLIACTDVVLDDIVDRDLELVARRKSGERLDIGLSVSGAAGEELVAVLRSPCMDGQAGLGCEEIHRQKEEMAERFSRRQQQDERLIWQLMHHDPLTGLPNRLLLTDHLSRALALAAAAGRSVAVMAVDIFHFKYINDTLGQAIGNFLLTTVAARLADRIGTHDCVGRLDGTEFGIVLTGFQRYGEVERMAYGLLAAINEPIHVGGHELVLAAIIGITLFPEDAGDPDTLFRNAGAAMCCARQGGGNRCCLYSAEQIAIAAARLALEEDLRHALARGEFEVHYQPQVDLRSGAIDAAEALVRWRRPGCGLVPPADFIPLAEETGLIVPLGDWVLQTACEQLGAWQAAGAPNLRMAVNLSARQFQRSGLARHVPEVVQRSGIRPLSLELEITESMLMLDVGAGSCMLRDLRRQGVRLAVDDFGTGYSSLSYLKRFALDTLKIDGGFVRQIPQDDSDAAIVRSVIALAHGLRLEVVAEGVETEAQLEFMREHRCDKVQGYFFSPPVTALDFEALLARGVSPSVSGKGLATW